MNIGVHGGGNVHWYSRCGEQYGGSFRSDQISRSVVSDSVTPWIAARQASLSITNSRSSLITKLKIQLPYDPGIPLLGICLEKVIVPKDKRQVVFISTVRRGKKRHRKTPWPVRALTAGEWRSCSPRPPGIATVYCGRHTAPPTPDLPQGVCPCVPGLRRMHQLLPRFTIPTGCLLWDTHCKSNTR